MPGPRRLVRRSIITTMRQGYDRVTAAATVLWVIDKCRKYLDLSDPGMSGWFATLEAEALKQVQAATSPTTHSKESDHGDRNTPAGGRPAGEGKA